MKKISIEWILDEEGDTLLGFKLGKKIIPLRDATYKDLGKITKYLNELKDYIPFEEADWPKIITEMSEGSEWGEEDIQIIGEELTKRQRIFLTIVDRDEWTSIEDVKSQFRSRGYSDTTSQSIAGLRAGLSTWIYGGYGKESLEEQYWNDEEEQNYYRIKEKYRGISKNFSF